MTRKTREAMTAKERIGHYKARIHNEIHDPMSDDDEKGMVIVTRSMCRELDNIVRAVEERCAKVADSHECFDTGIQHKGGYRCAEKIAAAIRGGK